MEYQYRTEINFGCGHKKVLSTVYAKFEIEGEKRLTEIQTKEVCRECRKAKPQNLIVTDLGVTVE